MSLQLQGGPMSAREMEQFRAAPFFQDALLLRRWDDAAKVPGLVVPSLANYVSLLAEAVAP